ncbi:MAG: hypothetical protein HYV09_18945 [Deltaproteobacteria bacterium]|nr:hypothetical protein [Deltaproteobacteria bacterium]
MSNHMPDSVRRWIATGAVTPTARWPVVLVLEPGGRITGTNEAARRLAGRVDVAWTFWDRVLASAADAHRVRDAIREAFRRAGETVSCVARVHRALELEFRCTAVLADAALLVAHERNADADGAKTYGVAAEEVLLDRSALTPLSLGCGARASLGDRAEHGLVHAVHADERGPLVRALARFDDAETTSGPWHRADGGPAFELVLRGATFRGHAALGATVTVAGATSGRSCA